MSNVFSRNFDFEFEQAQAELEVEAAPPPATIPIVEAEMLAEKARNEGREEGMITGAAQALSEERASRAARADDALVALTQGLHDIVLRDRQLRSEVELTMAELMIGIGERVLPDLFSGHIGDLLVARIQTVVQLASGNGRVSIRIPPELADELTPKLDAVVQVIDSDTMDIRTVVDPHVEDGTIQMNWKNGFVEYDPALASAEALNILKEAILELRLQAENMP